MKKRVFSVLLALSLCLSMVPANAAEAVESDAPVEEETSAALPSEEESNASDEEGEEDLAAPSAVADLDELGEAEEFTTPSTVEALDEEELDDLEEAEEQAILNFEEDLIRLSALEDGISPQAASDDTENQIASAVYIGITPLEAGDYVANDQPYHIVTTTNDPSSNHLRYDPDRNMLSVYGDVTLSSGGVSILNLLSGELTLDLSQGSLTLVGPQTTNGAIGLGGTLHLTGSGDLTVEGRSSSGAIITGGELTSDADYSGSIWIFNSTDTSPALSGTKVDLKGGKDVKITVSSEMVPAITGNISMNVTGNVALENQTGAVVSGELNITSGGGVTISGSGSSPSIYGKTSITAMGNVEISNGSGAAIASDDAYVAGSDVTITGNGTNPAVIAAMKINATGAVSMTNAGTGFVTSGRTTVNNATSVALSTGGTVAYLSKPNLPSGVSLYETVNGQTTIDGNEITLHEGDIEILATTAAFHYKCGNGTADYAPSTYTLTLNNATISGKLTVHTDLTIVLKGICTINGSIFSQGDLNLSGGQLTANGISNGNFGFSDKLTLSGTAVTVSYLQWMPEGGIQLTNSSSLTVDGGSSTSYLWANDIDLGQFSRITMRNAFIYNYATEVTNLNDLSDFLPAGYSIGAEPSGVITVHDARGIMAKNFSLEKNSPGVALVRMEDWDYGETASTPVPTSTTNSTTQVTYVYKVKDADDSAYTVEKPSYPGTYTVKATFPATGHYLQTCATCDFIIRGISTVTPPTFKSLTYSGQPQELVSPGSTQDGTLLYSLSETGTYTQSVPTAANAGTYTVWYKVQGDSTHSGTDPDHIQAIISPKDLTQAVVEITTDSDTPTYNGQDQTKAVTAVTADGQTLTPGKDYVISGNQTANAGTHTLTVHGQGNYVGTATQQWEIAKAAPEQEKLTGTITLSCHQTTVDNQVELEGLLPRDHGLVGYTVTSDEKAVDNVSVDMDGLLTFDSRATGEAVTDTIIVTAVMQNYKDVTFTITIDLVDKTAVTITGISASGKLYDGQPAVYTGTPAAVATQSGAVVTPTGFTYTWLTADGQPPTDAGSYELAISVNEDDPHYVGGESVVFTIQPIPITIAAADKAAETGGSLPELTYTVSDSLVGSDRLSDALTLTCDADMTQAGTYPIQISGGEVVTDQGMVSPNYEITLQDGVLTVTEKAVDPTPAPVSGASGGRSRSSSSTAASNTTPAVQPETTQPAADPAAQFTDVAAGQWYYDAVSFVLSNNLMEGLGETTFAPNNDLTRTQILQILYSKEGKPAVTHLSVFTDVESGQWYTDAVSWAVSNGLISGYGNGQFGVNDSVTREQLAFILWRYAGSPAPAQKALAFADAEQVSPYAGEALRWAFENGILSGTGDDRLSPQGVATRAQFAQMLMRFLGK
jgi:methionine-rich copper-binding protein CopC